MQIVTLTTDWGYGDYYMGVVKGRLYSTIADVQVVDITHNIRKYDNLSAAFVVKNAKRDGVGKFTPEEITFIVQGEMAYCESLDMFE